jgi:hypothetical protein
MPLPAAANGTETEPDGVELLPPFVPAETTAVSSGEVATTTIPSEAVTWQVYVAPGVNPVTVIGDDGPLAEPVTPPVLDVQVTVYVRTSAAAAALTMPSAVPAGSSSVVLNATVNEPLPGVIVSMLIAVQPKHQS